MAIFLFCPTTANRIQYLLTSSNYENVGEEIPQTNNTRAVINACRVLKKSIQLLASQEVLVTKVDNAIVALSQIDQIVRVLQC